MAKLLLSVGGWVRETHPWYLHMMVAQKMLRPYEGKRVFSETAPVYTKALNRFFNPRPLQTCATISLLPSNVSSLKPPAY